MKHITKLLSHRVATVVLLLLIQLGAILALLSQFNEYYVYFYTLCDLMAVIITVYIVSLKSNPGYKIAWIVTIMTIPLFGVLLYMIFGGNRLSKREKKKMLEIYHHTKAYFDQDIETEQRLKVTSSDAYVQSKYIRDYALCPVHEHTKTTYFSRGEDFYTDFLAELKKAKQFIFIEFFIIAEGTMWNTTLDILEQKAKEGVDVRLLYDDMGCIFTLPKDYDQQ